MNLNNSKFNISTKFEVQTDATCIPIAKNKKIKKM